MMAATDAAAEKVGTHHCGNHGPPSRAERDGPPLERPAQSIPGPDHEELLRLLAA